MKWFICGKHGHIRTACPLVKEAQNARNGIESNSGKILNAPENNDPAEVTSESAAPDPNAEKSAFTEIGEHLHPGCSVDITETVAKISDAGQSGTNYRVEAIVELALSI